MPHPNDMSTWTDISCQRGHDWHDELTVHIDLSVRHGYHDCPPIPSRLAREFDMFIFDWQQYSEDGLYCPAHDAVSETIATEGVWEPAETILALHVLTQPIGYSGFVDLGAQIGWFSLLAASTGHPVLAVDADSEPLRLLRASMVMNGWKNFFDINGRIGSEVSHLWTINEARLVKIDVEGAEDDAVAAIWPQLVAGVIDHLLLEVSPVFDDYYPDLVRRIIDAGYECYLLPQKKHPPYQLVDVAYDMKRWRVDTNSDLESFIASRHQDNYWFKREGVEW